MIQYFYIRKSMILVLLLIISNILFVTNLALSASVLQQPGLNVGQVGIPLSPNAQNAQGVQTRANIATGSYAAAPLNLNASNDWRLNVRKAAITTGDMVLLGEIAEPVGPIPPETWEALRNQPLWPAPPQEGEPLQISKINLERALRDTLGDLAARCILPNSLAIQKGGLVVLEGDLRNYVISYLTPQTNLMPGMAEFVDFSLPEYIFLAHGQQRVNLEPGEVAPGRVTFRFSVQEANGETLRRVSGSAFLNLWMDVPAAARPLNQGDALNVEDITFTRVNAAHLTAMPWDGQGGPWQAIRSIGAGQTIFSSDIATLAMILRGSIVNLVFERNGMVISTRGECMSDGVPGETIAVKNLSSEKQVYGVIRDSNTVVVQ